MPAGMNAFYCPGQGEIAKFPFEPQGSLTMYNSIIRIRPGAETVLKNVRLLKTLQIRFPVVKYKGITYLVFKGFGFLLIVEKVYEAQCNA